MCIRDRPFLSETLSWRLARNYGTLAWTVLGEARTLADLGEDFGAELHAAEVRFLIEKEWVRTADDLLWRRSRLGLHVPQDGQQRLAAFIDRHLADPLLSIGSAQAA